MIYKGSIVKGSGGGSGDAVWGSITGTLSDQTDLADALATKQATLVSGTNIKTVNNTSILGEGNIEISGSVAVDESTIDFDAQDKLQALGVVNQNAAAGATTPLKLWEGTEQEYNTGGGQKDLYYKWTSVSKTQYSTPDLLIVSKIKFVYDKYYLLDSESGYPFYYSVLGKNLWTAINLTFNVNDITYGNNKFVCVGTSSKTAYSSDGITWAENSETLDASMKHIAFGNDRFVAMSAKNGHVAYSLDGISWTNTTLQNTSYTIYDLIFAKGKFYALTETKILSTEDGITWTENSLPSDVSWNSICYGNNKFVILSKGNTLGKTSYSSDGINWSNPVVINNPQSGYNQITFGDGYFVIIRTSSIIYSSDGVNWSNDISLTGTTYGYICYGNGAFVAANEEDKVSYIELSSVYTLDENPTTASQVYLTPGITSTLTISNTGTGTITLSDSVTYTYDIGGSAYSYYTVGESYPTWLCNIEGVGVKIGSTMIADYSAPAIGDIDTALTAIIAQGS